jgi:hypothetical protein
MEKKKYTTGFNRAQRESLRKALSDFVINRAKEVGLPEEAVVQEIRYWQQSNSQWRTNPTSTDKRRSFRHWSECCWVCGDPIDMIADATFHHLKRGIPNLHAPENMVPLHRNEDFGCHEKLHNAPSGSLTAGSLRKRG